MNVQSNLTLTVLRSEADAREAQLRRTSLPVSEHHPRRVRRWVGRKLVRLGTRLAGEPTMRPVRAP